MITYQEAIERGLKLAGTEPQPDFIVTSISYKVSQSVHNKIYELQEFVNQKLKIIEYSNTILQLTIKFVIYPEVWNGASHPERKFYKRSAKHFFMDIRIPDYQGFCNADEQTALRILSEQTLRGTEKFLSKVKDFDYQRFSSNLKEVLKAYLDIKA